MPTCPFNPQDILYSGPRFVILRDDNASWGIRIKCLAVESWYEADYSDLKWIVAHFLHHHQEHINE